MIEDYGFGSMTVNGKTYSNDLILHGETVLDDSWWREDGHNIAIKDLAGLPEEFDVLVIGNGANGVCQVPEKTIDHVKKTGADVIVEKTGKATETYNQLLSEGKDVIGAFHLTC